MARPGSSEDDDSSALLRVAIKMLEDLRGMLAALSPAEIASATLLRRGQAAPDVAACWTVYERRHRVFLLVLEREYALLAPRVLAHLQRRKDRGAR
jgi:hypothetical protein